MEGGWKARPVRGAGVLVPALAIFPAGGMTGSFSVKLVVNCFGRRSSMIIVNLLATIGGCLMGFCKLAEAVAVQILGRLVMGLLQTLHRFCARGHWGESSYCPAGAVVTLNWLGIVSAK